MVYKPVSRERPATGFQVALSNEQNRHAIDSRRLTAAAEAVLRDSTFTSAAISIAVVDDATIHELNRRHLNHDWPTDVLSFVLGEDERHLEGEVIISADTAAATAEELGHSADVEQLLYVIHGILHLVGCRDKSDVEVKQMRAAEARYLEQFGFIVPLSQFEVRTESKISASKAPSSCPLPKGAGSEIRRGM
jgi:probable rRNA maturation factor